jgi:dipeptide/tripeptide permease
MEVISAGGLLGLVALALYGRDILHLYRARKRRTIELNSRIAAVALANLAATVLLAAVLLASRTFERDIAAPVFLLTFGWLSGLGLAKLYKIIAFLTWLECYGPVLGKTTTPRVQDLVVEHRAMKWFVLYFAAVWGATAVLLLGWPQAFRAASVIMLIATGGIIVQLVRIRTLTDVQARLRWPAGVRPPRLLHARI